MKKIKRLELRTGQVLNPQQQGFVVGGNGSSVNWIIMSCNCQNVGQQHSEYRTEPIGNSGTFVDVINFVSGIFGMGDIIPSGIRTHYRTMVLKTLNPYEHSCIKEWSEDKW